jgi:hypothetical protein
VYGFTLTEAGTRRTAWVMEQYREALERRGAPVTRYLTLEDRLFVASQACGTAVVRDHGLLESALAQPAATVFGSDAYPALHTKAAAALHSLARNHALVDGNKRLAAWSRPH